MSRKTRRRPDPPPPTPPPATRSQRLAAEVKSDDEMTDDKVAELWSEFAADHYEIVDQLPLELHRNSRLLRELDEESLCEWSSGG